MTPEQGQAAPETRLQSTRVRWRLAALFVTGTVVLALAGAAQALDVRSPFQPTIETWEPSSHIGGLAQSEDGALWLATRTGLQRFDGKTFTVLGRATTPPLPDDQVSCVRPARDGGLWLGMSKTGLLRLREDAARAAGLSIERWTEGEGLPSNEVTALAQTASGELWIGTKRGLALLRGGHIVRRWGRAEGLSDDAVILVIIRADGRVMVETNDGLSRVDGDRVTTEPLEPPYTDSRRQRMLEEFLPAGAPPASDPIWRSLPEAVSGALRDRDGHVWIGTSMGLVTIEDGKLRRWDVGQGLAGNHVNSLIEDREGAIWASSFGGGLTRLSSPRLRSLTVREGLPHDTTFAVAEGRSGKLFVATVAGVVAWDGDGFSSIAVNPDLNDPWTSLAVDGADRLWLLSAHGRLHRLVTASAGGVANDASAFAIERVSTPGTFTTLATDAEGQVVAGSSSGGVYRVGRDGDMVLQGPEAGSPVSILATRSQGGLWVGRKDGTVTGIDGAGHLVAGPYTIPGRPGRVSDLLEWPAGTLWAGTFAGLFRLEGDVFKRPGPHVVLTDRFIGGLVADEGAVAGEVRLWVGTERGIIRCELDATTGRGPLREPSVFGRADGLVNDEVANQSQRVGLRSRDGRLWFATGRGVALVEAPARWVALPPAQPDLTKVVIDGLPVIPARDHLVIPPGRGNVEIQYGAAAFSWSHRLSFRHLLEGFDADWIVDGEQRSVRYTNLRPGTYNFRVEAMRGGENRNRAASTAMRMTLEPHFSQTVYFYASLLLGAAVIVFVIQRLRVRQVETRFAAVLAERNRIARDLHDTLAQVFSAIGFQLDGLAGRFDREASEDLRRLRQMIAHGRLAARNVVANLRGEAAARGLAASLRELPRLYEGVAFLVDVAGETRALAPAVERELLRISEEAVSNAIAHGRAGHLSIELRFEPHATELWIRDDGAGFAAGTDGLPGGFGLLGMRERASRIGATLEIDSEPGVGTEVGVVVPRDRENQEPAR
jgi:signal transduction histidine kinase/ligand-binding sensor domain-containing protein